VIVLTVTTTSNMHRVIGTNRLVTLDAL